MTVPSDTRFRTISSSSTSVKDKLRDILTPRPKLFSQSSRIPVLKKRNARDHDDPDGYSSPNTRARTRQRVDSGVTIAIAREREKRLSRQASNESVRTITPSSMKARHSPYPLPTTLVASRPAPIKPTLSRQSSSRLQFPLPPTHTDVPFPVARKSSPDGATTSHIATVEFPARPPPPPRTLKRTKSTRQNLSVVTDPPLPPSRTSVTNECRRSSPSSADVPRSPSPDFEPVLEDPFASNLDLPPDVLHYLVEDVDEDDLDAKEFRELMTGKPSVGGLDRSKVMEDDDEIPWICPESPIIPLHVPSTRVTPPTPTPPSSNSRFEVEIMPCNRQVAQWDLQDGDIFAWPALLCIKDHHFDKYGPKHGFEYPLIPPVHSLKLTFRTPESQQSLPLTLSPQESPQYTVTYTGQILAPHLVPLRMVPHRGICLENSWHRGPFLDPLKELGTENRVDASYALKFHVPVPAWLFAGHDVRVFSVEAKVELSDEDLPGAGGEDVYVGSTRVMIEHLRSEVLMDGCKSFSRRIS